MKMTTAYACTWLSTAIAVSFGIYITKNANCLWALLIPACINFSNSKNSED